jgi:hypothetical protein
MRYNVITSNIFVSLISFIFIFFAIFGITSAKSDSSQIIPIPPLTYDSEKVNEAFKSFISQFRWELPGTIKEFLIALGFPEELTQTWITFILYIVVPLILFTIIVHDLLFASLEKTLLQTFSNYPRMGWILSFFIVLSLVPLKVVGPFILWIYLNAAAFAVYGVAIVIVLIVITKIMGAISKNIGTTTRGRIGRLLFLISIAVLFFFPNWYGVWLSIGIYVVLLIGTSILMGFFGYFSRKKAEKEELKKMKQIKDIKKHNIEMARNMLRRFFLGSLEDIKTAVRSGFHYDIYQLLKDTQYEDDAQKMYELFKSAVVTASDEDYRNGAEAASRLLERIEKDIGQPAY